MTKYETHMYVNFINPNEEQEVEKFLIVVPENREDFYKENSFFQTRIESLFWNGVDYGINTFSLVIDTQSWVISSNNFSPDNKVIDVSDAQEFIDDIYYQVRELFYKIKN